MKIELDDKAVCHLERLLDHCEPDEESHYEECGRPRDHVYRDIRALRKVLERVDAKWNAEKLEARVELNEAEIARVEMRLGRLGKKHLPRGS
jgi:hypothetical protein